MTNHPTTHQATRITALTLAFFSAAGAGATAQSADFGDAPDGSGSCQGGAVVDPSLYPTLVGSSNAVPGREGPHHFPLGDPNGDYFLGLAPSQEPLVAGPFQPDCDWLTPPCDTDDGPFVLCLNPGCTTGVVSVPGGPCGEAAVAAFGLTPTATAFWIFEASRGPFSTQPGFINVSADWDLDAHYGSVPGEWVVEDEPLAVLPWSTQIFVSAPFPATTVFPCPNPLGWCIDPFWTRFHLSDEPMAPTFDGVSAVWDGSGRTGGYAGGETEDVIVESDPQEILDGPVVTCGLPAGNVRLTLDLGDPSCSGCPLVQLGSNSAILVRRFGSRAFETGFPYLTEILQLTLVGHDPMLGRVRLSERADVMSLGKLDQVQAANGKLLAATSFFDISYRIELPDQGLVLDTGPRPARLDAGFVRSFPPTGQPYRPPLGSQPLALLLAGTDIPVGWLAPGELVVAGPCPKAAARAR